MGRVGLLVDMDYCVGCWACQSACSNHNSLPVGQTFLRLINNQAEEVDGEIKLYKFPYPLALEKCADCVRNGGVPICVSTCIGRALTIGDADALFEKAKNLKGKTAIFL
jgi:Fe-S-cluster-containing dehydrogenase component